MDDLYRLSRRVYVTLCSVLYTFLDSEIHIPLLSLFVVAPPQETYKLKRVFCALNIRLETAGECSTFSILPRG